MSLIIIFLIYNIIQMLTFPLLIGYLAYRKIRGKDFFGCWRERLGWVPRSNHECNKTVVWVHAVSVGEVFSVQYVIDELKKNNPDLIIYLTVGTSAGKQVAQKNLNADYVSFIPFDFLPFMLLGFYRIKPSVITVVEAEIWPNFLILSYWFNIPKSLINARISTRSFERYKLLKTFLAPILGTFDKILTQSKDDSERFAQIGVNGQRLATFGDIKAFNVIHKKQSSVAIPKTDYTILLVGSVHPGELGLYLNLFLQIKQSYPDSRLVVVPRHFNWLRELEVKLKTTELNYTIWTDQNSVLNKNENLSQTLNVIFRSNDIIAVCKLGELFNLCQISDIFYLGGTFVNIGGHNLLEAAVCLNPCVIGPFYQNTRVNADGMEKAGGLIKVENFKQLKETTQKLLSNEALRIKMGNANYLWVCGKGKEIDEKKCLALN